MTHSHQQGNYLLQRRPKTGNNMPAQARLGMCAPHDLHQTSQKGMRFCKKPLKVINLILSQEFAFMIKRCRREVITARFS